MKKLHFKILIHLNNLTFKKVSASSDHHHQIKLMKSHEIEASVIYFYYKIQVNVKETRWILLAQHSQ